MVEEVVRHGAGYLTLIELRDLEACTLMSSVFFSHHKTMK